MCDQNAVHVKPAVGRLEVVLCIIATSKGSPGDSNSYLLAQLEHQRGQSVHGRGAQLRCAVKCANNRVDNPGSIVSEVQGFC